MGSFCLNLSQTSLTLSSRCSSFLIPPSFYLKGSVSFCKAGISPYSSIFFSAGLVMKNLTKISTKLMQGIMIVLSISLLSKIGKFLQMQSIKSTEWMFNLDSVEIIKSTSQIKSKIMANIQALKACLRSDFFLFIRDITVQITKKKPDPMMVLKMKPGTLKAQAYQVPENPKESQVSLLAG